MQEFRYFLNDVLFPYGTAINKYLGRGFEESSFANMVEGVISFFNNTKYGEWFENSRLSKCVGESIAGVSFTLERSKNMSEHEKFFAKVLSPLYIAEDTAFRLFGFHGLEPEARR